MAVLALFLCALEGSDDDIRIFTHAYAGDGVFGVGINIRQPAKHGLSAVEALTMRILINGGCTRTTAHIAHNSPLRKYLGWMNTPFMSHSFENLTSQGCRSICLDNAAYSNFCSKAYRSMLRKWEGAVISVEWVTLPDVVCDAQTTVDLFWKWYPRLDGFKKAFVAQNGAESMELPWHYFECLFIGGDTDWKLSECAVSLVEEAKHRRKIVHMGRVNSQKRLRYAYQIGCDSIDGTGYSKYNKTELLPMLRYVDQLHRQQFLEF